jgi:hypothetical protein
MIVPLEGNKIWANVAETDRVMREKRVKVDMLENELEYEDCLKLSWLYP